MRCTRGADAHGLKPLLYHPLPSASSSSSCSSTLTSALPGFPPTTPFTPLVALHYCFSLLATIGVTRLPLYTEAREEDVISVLFTSLYILVGVALVSMCLHSLQGGISSLVSSLRTGRGSSS